MTRSQLPFFGDPGPPDSDHSTGRRDRSIDGSFEVADSFGRAFAKSLMAANPEIRTNFQSTLRELVGQEFTRQEFDTLEDRALNAVNVGDVLALKGIYAGVPVVLTKRQKKTIDGVMGGLGDDALGARARSTYEEALRNGKIKVR